MARYTGPRLKLMRALGLQLPGLSRKSIERKPYPPGMHRGQSKSKKSGFAIQLQEKQKLQFNFNITERALRRIVREAFNSRQHAGHKVLEYLERRLDSFVFRAGFAPTIPAARQLVSHNHILVNGKRVNIASFRVQPGQVVSLTAKALKNPHVAQSLEAPSLSRPAWLGYDASAHAATMLALPTHETFPFPIEISLVVEYYARSVK